MRYGYIGLGQMGAAMAGHLISTGSDVTVFDLDGPAVEAAVGKGGKPASSSAEIAATCDVISICVPAAEHIEAVLTGDDGIHAGARPGTVVLLHSTVHPETMRSARETAAKWDVGVFDACIAGGAAAAEQGELVIFAGGLGDLPAPARALLEVYGSKIIDAGPVGAGAAMKIAVNVMTYAQFSAAGAAHDIVRAAGASTEALLEAWRHTGMLGRLTEQMYGVLGIPPEHITGDFRGGMEQTVYIQQKDLELAAELAGETRPGVPGLIDAIHAAIPAVFGVHEEQQQ